MTYKTPEEMIDYIVSEHLLTDACMTIIDGRNEYGFHATEIPKESIKDYGDGAYEILLSESKEKDIKIPVHIKDTSKETAFWLMQFGDKKGNIVAVQHDKGENENTAAIKKKEYLSVIAMFLDHYKIGTRTKLMNVLKYGYAQLKRETGENDPYELLRDFMDEGLSIQRAEQIPERFGLRFKFHFEEE